MEDFNSSVPKTDKFNISLNQTEESVPDENEERVQTITTSSKQDPEFVTVNFKHVTKDHHARGISKPNLLKKSLLFPTSEITFEAK